MASSIPHPTAWMAPLAVIASLMLSACGDSSTSTLSSTGTPADSKTTVQLDTVVAAEDRGTPARSVAAEEQQPRRRILHAWDGVTMWATIFNVNYYGSPNRKIPEPAAEFSKRMLEEMIDEEAAAGVDSISYCLFTAFMSDVPSSKVTELFPWRPPGMDKAGMDLLEVLIDRCHHHDMKFIADVRMNDRHGGPRKGLSKQHPEWSLLGSGNDFAIAGVRDAMLAFSKEVLDAYEVDGLEYDYMRWCHMFQPGQGKQNAQLLTELTRRTRKLLDESARRRGVDRLALGVRVPQSLKECEYLGFDLATWIKEGLVDYVVPSDFFHSDTNMKTEDFVKLTEGTSCEIYPAIHPMISMDGPNEHYRLMSLTNYRAAAQNYYAFGAHGISPYNYQRGFQRRASAHRSSSNAAYLWPAALGWLGELSQPDQVNSRDRHYLFYAIYKKPRKSPTGFSNDENIYLDRSDSSTLQGQRRFRMAEDFSNRRLRTTIQFKAIGLSPDDSLEIRINDTKVPDDYISRVHDKNGQNVYEGDTLPAFDLYVIDTNWETTGRKQPLIFGDNQLSVRLLPSAGATKPQPFRFAEMVLGVQADDRDGISNVDLNGSLDDFAIWSRVLGDDEIKAVRANGLEGIGIHGPDPGKLRSPKLANGLQVLYEFEKREDLGWNSADQGKSAAQTGPSGALVTRDDKDPRIGDGSADFSANDATLKVHAGDMQRLMQDKTPGLTIACWFQSTSRSANHTILGMSNQPIPSPLYSTNQAKAVLATLTVEAVTPHGALLGLVRPGDNETGRTDTKLIDGTWHHLAVTIEQDTGSGTVTGRLFVDGAPGTKVMLGDQSTRLGTRRVSIEELECYVYVRK
jgi:hypothetical protein